MPRIRIKICGLTRLEDAELAVALGADALGFVFWPQSPRAVRPDVARAIADRLPPFPVRVGVFVNASPDEVARIAEAAALDAVQLHGDEPAAAFERLGKRLIKSVALDDDRAAASAATLPRDVLPLVDASDRDRRGGTGRTADWERAARLASTRPILLAGGLTAENVARAVRRVRPWGVDVSSGVEEAPGIKSHDRLRAFFRALAELRSEDQ